MNGRIFRRAAAAGFATAALYAYLAQLRYERAFYRRYLLEAGKDPNHD